MALSQDQKTPSPGNALYPDLPPMYAPHMEFVYRMQAKLSAPIDIANMQGIGLSRSIIPVVGGTVRGSQVNGVLVENSGADWAQRVHARQQFYKLDARYTVRTDDGHYIYIVSKGLFRPGPGVRIPADAEDEAQYLQDKVEYFTNLTFEAAGDSPYNWMNGIVAFGVLAAVDDAAIVDCWRLTNFPGKDVESVYVGR